MARGPRLLRRHLHSILHPRSRGHKGRFERLHQAKLQDDVHGCPGQESGRRRQGCQALLSGISFYRRIPHSKRLPSHVGCLSGHHEGSQALFESWKTLRDSSHRVLVYPDGFQHGLLARAAPGSPLNRLYVNNVDLKPMSTSVAIEAILNGTFENTLTMKNDLPVMQLPHWPCAIDALDIVLHRFANGYVFSKNWPYTDLVNHHLKKLVLETGVYKRIRDQVISHASKRQSLPE